MRHQVTGRKLNRPTPHRMSMYRNLVADLLKYGKLTTTEAKAKEMRGMVDKVITLGKEGSLASRRMAISFARDEEVVKKVFSSLASQYSDRKGGYTRIVKLGTRQGDGANMVKIELV